MTDNILEAQQLTRRYGGMTAVNAVDFHVRNGERYALTGPRGAGKTTLIAMLGTLVRPSSGIANIDGFQLSRENAAIRGRIGVVFADSLMDGRLSIRENLRFRAALYGIRGPEAADAVARAAAATGITDLLKARYGRLDDEERRRADFARALVNTPGLLLLDDVAAGLDAETASAVLDLARRLPRETGAGVLQTSRDIREVAGADRIAIMDQGRILAEGTPAQLVDRYAADRLRLVPRSDPGCRQSLVRLLGNEGYRFTPGTSPDSPVIEVAIGNSMGALLLVNRIVHWIDRFEMLRGDLKVAYDQALLESRSGAGGLSAAMEGLR